MRTRDLVLTALLAFGGSAATAAPEALPVPKSLVVEHEAVHEQLQAALEEGGEVGTAARDARAADPAL